MKPLHLNIGITLDAESVAALLGFMRCEWDDPNSQQLKMMPTTALQNALLAGQQPPAELGLLLDKKEVAKLLNVSARHVSSLQVTGRMPKPVRMGRVVRWRCDEIKAWVEAGCPHRDRWTWDKRVQ